jgi:hypothetical protein
MSALAHAVDRISLTPLPKAPVDSSTKVIRKIQQKNLQQSALRYFKNIGYEKKPPYDYNIFFKFF